MTEEERLYWRAVAMLELHEGHGKSLSEIGRFFGVNHNTVNRQMMRARMGLAAYQPNLFTTGGGRPTALDEDKILDVIERLRAGDKKYDLALELGVCLGTIDNYIRKYKRACGVRRTRDPLKRKYRNEPDRSSES
jgi:transposase